MTKQVMDNTYAIAERMMSDLKGLGASNRMQWRAHYACLECMKITVAELGVELSKAQEASLSKKQTSIDEMMWRSPYA